MSEIEIKQNNGMDIVRYMPKGVCAKLIQIMIKDDIIQNIEFVGGCSGNLTGISMLSKAQNINDIVAKLKGVPCGSKTTSCPDQLSQALVQYIEYKNSVKV